MTTIEELRAKARRLREESAAAYKQMKKFENEEWLPKATRAWIAEEELRDAEFRAQIRAEIEAEKANQ